MTPLSYTPPRTNRYPETVASVALLFLVASVLFLVLEIGLTAVWQITFFLSSGTVIYILSVYVVRSHTYRIEDGLFTVHRRQGRRITCLCRLSLANLAEVRPFTEEDKGGRDPNLYTYCNNFAPADTALLVFHDGEKRVTVRIETAPALLSVLQAVAAQNATRQKTETEETP